MTTAVLAGAIPRIMVNTSWFDSLGRWSNLLQGLGSAIIGGLVAAVTAYLVVRWTHKSNMLAAAEMDARSVVRGLKTDSLRVLADIQELLAQPATSGIEQLWRLIVEIRLCQMRFGTAFNVSFPTIALVDAHFANAVVSPFVDQIVESFAAAENNVQSAIDAQKAPAPPAVAADITRIKVSLSAAATLIDDLNRACATWLGTRR
jgi:hypothetical protein